jgi:hypothetical protein
MITMSVDGSTTRLAANAFVVAPNKVNCNTVLPNGETLGQYINQGRAQMQASVNAGGYSYTYDRYGNRLQQNPSSQSGMAPQLTFNPSTTGWI